METAAEIRHSLEAERLKVLKKYDLLDTPPDKNLDGLTELATRFFDTPLALVTLVDKDRIWFKSRWGVDLQEVPREPGFCDTAIWTENVYVVEDAFADPLASKNSLVCGDQTLRFYAGYPLQCQEGAVFGTFCVLDRQPRTFSLPQTEGLKMFARMAMQQIEMQFEARNAVKHQHYLLNTAVHDLKNPLSAIPLLADLVVYHKEDPKLVLEISQKIKEAGKRMTGVIDNLLETAVEEAGRILLRLATVPFAPLILGVIESNTALAKNKDQVLHLEIQEECEVYADARRLIEVVDNLVNNAIKYSPRGRNIYISLEVSGQWAVLKVRDEGQGLTKDDIKNLYRRFTSLSATPTGGENSTGLGLSIVKNIIDAHHGQITALSEGRNKGTTFIVELPLSESGNN